MGSGGKGFSDKSVSYAGILCQSIAFQVA